MAPKRKASAFDVMMRAAKKTAPGTPPAASSSTVRAPAATASPMHSQGEGAADSVRVPCPICGRRFQPDLIEAHAGGCLDFGASPSKKGDRGADPASVVVVEDDVDVAAAGEAEAKAAAATTTTTTTSAKAASAQPTATTTTTAAASATTEAPAAAGAATENKATHPFFLGGARPAPVASTKKKGKYEDAPGETMRLVRTRAKDGDVWRVDWRGVGGGGLPAAEEDESSELVLVWRGEANVRDAPTRTQNKMRLEYVVEDRGERGGDAAARDTADDVWEPPAPTTQLPAPVLKSAMQKNIRRCRALAACRCMLQLASASTFEDCVRRLSVIVIEDCILHPALPLLVWLTCAISKGVGVRRGMVDAVLRICWDLAAVRTRDVSFYDLPDAPAPPPPTTVRSASPEVVLHRCMLLRASFGGMKGDMAMLRRAAHDWSLRFRTDDVLAPPAAAGLGVAGWAGGRGLDFWAPAAAPTRWLSYLNHLYACVERPAGGGAAPTLATAGKLETGDVPLVAVDPHCSQIMAVVVRDNAYVWTKVASYCKSVFGGGEGSDPEALVYAAIWKFRGGKSLKVGRPPVPPPQGFVDDATKADAEGKEEEALLGLLMIFEDRLDDFASRFISGRMFALAI